MTFVITVSEPGKDSIAYTITIQTPVLVAMGASLEQLTDDFAGGDSKYYYYKHTYRVGDQFDRDSIVVAGTYEDGSRRRETLYEVEGFDSSTPGTCNVRIRKRNIYATIPYGTSVKNMLSVNIMELSPSHLFFDYGRRISTADAVPGRYTVTEGNKLVIAPVLWRVPETATFSWQVSGGSYEANGKFLTFKSETATGTYTATVTAVFEGKEVQASTTVECVNSETTPSASTVAGMSALAQSTGEHRSWNTSLGGYGGYLIKKLHVINNTGYDFCINGNAFGNWAEPGIVWVMKDENGNNEADDTWYELKGSGDAWGIVIRRYAVSFYKYPNVADSVSAGWWEDSLGNWGTLGYGYYDKNWPDKITFAGSFIPHFGGHFGSTFWGYADVLDNRFDIANAIHVDGTPKEFDSIDFIRVQTAENNNNDLFGERSTEITNGASGITLLWDSSRTLTGSSTGGGYLYKVVNSSGYALTVSFKDVSTSYAVGVGETKDITLPGATAYFNFVGGNVRYTISGNTVSFVDN